MIKKIIILILTVFLFISCYSTQGVEYRYLYDTNSYYPTDVYYNTNIWRNNYWGESTFFYSPNYNYNNPRPKTYNRGRNNQTYNKPTTRPVERKAKKKVKHPRRY